MGSGECQEQYAINISEEMVSEWIYTPADTVLITIAIPIIFCLGVITNSSFLFVLFRVPTIRSDTYVYLMHLALADLLYLSLAATYDIWNYTASLVKLHDPFVNSAECVSFFIVINTAYFASIALVTMVSFEKFSALCHPIKHLKIRGRRRTYRLVAICWLVGLVFSGAIVPELAIPQVYCLQWPDIDEHQDFPSTTAYCGAVQPWVPYYTSSLQTIPWLIAVIANIYMCIKIFQALNKRRITSTVDRNHQVMKVRHQVAAMLIVNCVVFFICQTPHCLITLSGWICRLAEIPDPISATLGNAGWWVSIIPQYINTMVNPLIYGAVNSQYRAAFVQACHCKARPREEHPVKPHFALNMLKAAEKSKATSQTSTNNEINETRL